MPVKLRSWEPNIIPNRKGWNILQPLKILFLKVGCNIKGESQNMKLYMWYILFYF